MTARFGALHGAPKGPKKGNHTASQQKRGSHPAMTIPALKRWSILNKTIPAVEQINAIHVYDFDNTLFKSALPNPKLWQTSTIGLLGSQDVFLNGGWWHDARILSATGQGADKEETRAWEGFWNEKIVELVQLSVQQKDALCILLTGRSDAGFSNIIKRMVTSKGLDFDLISLKPSVGPQNQVFHSTMHFKQTFLECVMDTYKLATEIRVYEDRPKHVKGFRDFMAEYNRKKGTFGTRAPIAAEVVQVADFSVTLDPVVEVAEVQQMVDEHNAKVLQHPRPLGGKIRRFKIKKTVYYTAYMIDSNDAERLLSLVQLPSLPESELKIHANSMIICSQSCSPSILDKVGGLGNRMKWEVTGTACYEGNVWAARVKPVSATVTYHTDYPVPLVILALRTGAKFLDAKKIQQWQPVPADKVFQFETRVGEKMSLRIDLDHSTQDEYNNDSINKPSKRKHGPDDDGRPRQPSGQGPAHRNDQKHTFHGGRGGYPNGGRMRGGANGSSNRGFRNGARGGGSARGGRGGRGGGHHYKSLDDLGTRDFPAGGFPQHAMSYEDDPPQSYPPVQHPPYQQPPLPPQHAVNPGFWVNSQAPYQPPAQPQPQQQLGGWPSLPGVQPNAPPTGPSGYGNSGPDMTSFY